MAIKVSGTTVIDDSRNTNTGILTATTAIVGSGVTVNATGLNATGIVTSSGGFNLGISSAGTSITSGPVKTLNFVGTGNTFAVSGTSVNISIASGGTNIFTILARSGVGVTVSAPASSLTVFGRSSNVSISI